MKFLIASTPFFTAEPTPNTLPILSATLAIFLNGLLIFSFHALVVGISFDLYLGFLLDISSADVSTTVAIFPPTVVVVSTASPTFSYVDLPPPVLDEDFVT